jgi:hypothetical protein
VHISNYSTTTSVASAGSNTIAGWLRGHGIPLEGIDESAEAGATAALQAAAHALSGIATTALTHADAAKWAPAHSALSSLVSELQGLGSAGAAAGHPTLGPVIDNICGILTSEMGEIQSGLA